MGTQLPSPKKEHSPCPIFGPCQSWPNGWMDQDATWYEGRLRPMPDCVKRGPSHPLQGAQQLPSFLAHVYCDHGRPSQLLMCSCCYCSGFQGQLIKLLSKKTQPTDSVAIELSECKPVWSAMQTKVYEHRIKDISELCQCTEVPWDELDQYVASTLQSGSGALVTAFVVKHVSIKTRRQPVRTQSALIVPDPLPTLFISAD